MTLYVDGAQKGTLGVTTHENFSGYWRVGFDGLGGWPDRPTSEHWAGLLDETAVYPAVLSAAQVHNHYALASAPADSVVQVTAAEDTYANAGAPDTNFGGSGSLAVRGTPCTRATCASTCPPRPPGRCSSRPR